MVVKLPLPLSPRPTNSIPRIISLTHLPPESQAPEPQVPVPGII
ncbi:unnamed protein product [Brugia pahangi]|uniref:Uncharacterized protein n=1 Tax=Brugia pahangi TaxID=6280 RepID=A0A0N4TN37_BRUPA|nr:unnamed protein product [Brugia pahangi]